MISKYKYVFIIGAGAHVPYGFPTGENLKQEIAKNIKKDLIKYKSKYKNLISIDFDSLIRKVDQFQEVLRGVNGVSIDHFINVNKNFSDIGIISIINEIYKFECNSILPDARNTIEGDWFTYLFSKMIKNITSNNDIGKFGKNKVAFISFNYDRSFEKFLYKNLLNFFKYSGVSHDKIVEQLNKIDIIHIYGKLGQLPWEFGFRNTDEIPSSNEFKNILQYGDLKIEPLAMALSSETLVSVMYSDRQKTSDIAKAQNLIKKADRILFLGFGFDEQNLKILGYPTNFDSKEVYATAFNTTKNERAHIARLFENTSTIDKLLYPDKYKNGEDPINVINNDSLTLLREFLVAE